MLAQLKDQSISLAYASLFGPIAIKCVLRRPPRKRRTARLCRPGRSSSSSSRPDEAQQGLWRTDCDQGKPTERDGDDVESADDSEDGSTGEEDVSLLRLDSTKPLLFDDLLSEVHRVHGPAIDACGGGVRIRYEDKDGDVVTVHSDDSLRYAHEDWLQQTESEPKKSWRLLVELLLEQDTTALNHTRGMTTSTATL
jgi:hypothetical protein